MRRNLKADTWHPYQRTEQKGPIRQAARLMLTEGAFMEISEKYKGSDRATRRATARAAAKKHWRKIKGLPEIDLR